MAERLTFAASILNPTVSNPASTHCTATGRPTYRLTYDDD